MGGLRKERFGRSVRGGEWRMRARYGGMETVGGDGSETRTVTKKKRKKSTTGRSYRVYRQCQWQWHCPQSRLQFRDKAKSNNN